MRCPVTHDAIDAHAPASPTRRTVLRTLIAGGIAWPILSDAALATLATAQQTGQPAPLAVLTPAQFAAVDALAEAIIPADAHSPGARAARVAEYIDLLLSESDAATKRTWADGLAALEAQCQQRYGATFAALSADRQTEILSEISRNEASPTRPVEVFFAATKEATIRGYYTSEIGIHRDLQYKGNQLLAEFVGCTHPEHGYVPPRA